MKTSIKDIVFFVLIVLVVGIAAFVSMNDDRYEEENMIIGIHIKGEVNAPGYYELSYGSRLKDAVLCAGGETASSDLGSVNLAQKLRDGEEIIIPAAQSEESTSGKININTADSYQLCKLDGIGEAIAADIIAYRAQNGRFDSINQLKKIDGIGDEKFEKIKDKITTL